MIKELHLNCIMIIIQIPTILCFMAPCLHVFCCKSGHTRAFRHHTVTKNMEVDSLDLLSILNWPTGKHIKRTK